MTNGSVPPADDQQSSSSITPTDGPPSETPSTVLEFDVTSLAKALEATYKAGWELAKVLPDVQSPPKVLFKTVVNPETREVSVQIILE